MTVDEQGAAVTAMPTGADSQDTIDALNERFWSELCGTQLARDLGVTDDSPESLRRFDEWYLRFYPYLDRHLRLEELAGQDVLEVGLGYGTVGQRLATYRARYSGLDVAAGPVRMMRHRLKNIGGCGDVRQGSILRCPFADESFDVVVSIGCYHHTGNLPRALDETWRVLRRGGRAMVMVYNAYSYRRWLWWPIETFRYWRWDKLGVGVSPASTARERAAYDLDSSGTPAPQTAFISVGHLRRMCQAWRRRVVYRENIGADGILGGFDRDRMVRWLGPWVGLDLYCHLYK